MQTFDKETLKESIIDNMKNLYRKTIDEATPQQVYQAVAYAVKDVIIDQWIATHKAYDENGRENRILSVHGISDGPGAGKQYDQYWSAEGDQGGSGRAGLRLKHRSRIRSRIRLLETAAWEDWPPAS